jgi:UDP-N-acetylmuramoylalanine--D-glutamate ligase
MPNPDDDAARAALLNGVDLVVTSPGFKPSDPLLAGALAAGIPVWSEVELAWRLRVPMEGSDSPAPWLCVTGTNGKTTTVEMLAAIIAEAGLEGRAVGNVGTPLIEAALDPTLQVLAVELSSFQLHFTHTMSAKASAVLNLAEDHLDWHGSFEAYATDKGRIFQNAQVACVYNVADPQTEELVRAADVSQGCRAVGFTLGIPGPGQFGVVEDVLVDRAFTSGAQTSGPQTSGAQTPATELTTTRRDATEIVTFADLLHLSPGAAVPAPHVIANALAASALARAHGIDPEPIKTALQTFTAGAHRIALVRTLDDVAYVDDSKATNAHAASASLASYAEGTVVWVAGGLVKGAHLDELVETRADRFRAAVVIGVDQQPFTEALAQHAPHIPVVTIDPGETDIMQSAVAAAQSLARPGDTVLLAPAGASMDQFRSYAQRGEAFAEAAQRL